MLHINIFLSFRAGLWVMTEVAFHLNSGSIHLKLKNIVYKVLVQMLNLAFQNVDLAKNMHLKKSCAISQMVAMLNVKKSIRASYNDFLCSPLASLAVKLT